MGAYDTPTFEWGPPALRSSVTQTDSFMLALNADTGATVWKTERKELPSWGTPTVAMTPAGPELVGSGYSASAVAADGKIYLSSEDGEMLVVAAGPTFRHIATNSMGEPLMATPAPSEGVMYVRSSRTLFAIGNRR